MKIATGDFDFFDRVVTLEEVPQVETEVKIIHLCDRRTLGFVFIETNSTQVDRDVGEIFKQRGLGGIDLDFAIDVSVNGLQGASHQNSLILIDVEKKACKQKQRQQ